VLERIPEAKKRLGRRHGDGGREDVLEEMTRMMEVGEGRQSGCTGAA
jgi:hypothetical protein